MAVTSVDEQNFAATAPGISQTVTDFLIDRWVGLTLLRNFIYDWRRFAKYSFVLGRRGRENRRAMIHILAHSLEHGMSLPEPRRGYGQEKATLLIGKITTYIKDFGTENSVNTALRVLDAYVAFHQKHGVYMATFSQALDSLNEKIEYRDSPLDGGVTRLTAAEIRQAVDFDFDRFMATRHSVRQYAARSVDPELIKQAVANARRAPSVCNRQTWRVYAITHKDAIKRVLSFQSGNAGFGHEVGVVFVITTNMQHMNLVGERYQGWVDGGIFAMALALSLLAKGLGACCLNWSQPLGVVPSRPRFWAEHAQNAPIVRFVLPCQRHRRTAPRCDATGTQAAAEREYQTRNWSSAPQCRSKTLRMDRFRHREKVARGRLALESVH